MTNEWRYFIADVNPEPWAIGDLSVGRKNGKYFPIVGRNHQMYAYQQAIKESLKGEDLWIDGPVELRFWFYRSISEYKSHQARTARSHEADLTNMQKATEDALQDVFFKNDKDVKHVESFMVVQHKDVAGLVVIGVRACPLYSLPSDVFDLVETFLDEKAEELKGRNEWG